MNKEFTPYEESLALKELGFDEPCIVFYKGNDKLKAVDQHWGSALSGISKSLGYRVDDLILAPTFSQAFRFFREKYGLRIRNYGSMNYSGELSEYFEIFKYGYGTSDKSLSIEVGALIYEEAELACLRKLIQIVKEKAS